MFTGRFNSISGKNPGVRTMDGTQNAHRPETIHFNLGASAAGFRFFADPLVIDLSSESRTLGTPIDGLIGADFFAGRSIKIDFRRFFAASRPA